MTIWEAKEKKYALEMEIRRKLNEFSEDTGITIEEIGSQRINLEDGRCFPY
jgi:hypothetical protein